jgi:hypothetical protein
MSIMLMRIMWRSLLKRNGLQQYQRKAAVIIITSGIIKIRILTAKKSTYFYILNMRRSFLTAATVLLLLYNGLNAQESGFSSSSLLRQGRWFKIPVTKEGVYRIDYSTLRLKGIADPSNPRIFGNNAGQLSFYNNGSVPDDLREMAVYLNTGSDGTFNEGDYLLFYAQGTHRWNFDHRSGQYNFSRHHYSDTAWYFITSGQPGKRIINAVQPSQAPTHLSSGSDALFIHESENENLIRSGRDWFQPVSSQAALKIVPGFTGLITNETIKYRIRAAARSSYATGFDLYEGTSIRKNIVLQGVNMFNTTGIYAATADSAGEFLPLTAMPVYEIRFLNKGDQGARGWIDFITLQARISNSFNGQGVNVRDAKTIGNGAVTSFTVKTQQQGIIVWDITDPLSVKNIQFTREGDNISFRSRTDSLRMFHVFTIGNAVAADTWKPVPNQDIHGLSAADMVIITHPLFLPYAEKLAGIHLENSGLVTEVVTPAQVYNEFSGGVPDIAALRNYLRMKYLRQQGTSRPLKYLLLFGDGSFENKTPPPKNPNFIPTWQSPNSNVVVSSFTSDDFYGLLDDGEGEAEGTEDLGIGRLPVSDTVQAGIALEKIRRYLDPVNMGDWKNIICLVADDEDGNIHMTDAEGLSALIEERAPEYNISKIYLDAYRQTTTVNGQTYPDVNRAINDRINQGCLIFNFVGHGNETGLTHERVVKIEDINLWKNGGKLPLFITATCEFSRFDDIEVNPATREMTGKSSAGEIALLSRDGGAIALMSTTRLVFSAPNYFLNRNIFNCAFERDSLGKPMRLGDIIRIAKNNSGNGSNKRNFSLLGDPALMLGYPWHGRVVTDSINGVPLNEGIDSLKALSLVTVSGHIEDNHGESLNNFNGIVSPLVYDKDNSIRTIANDGGSVMEFRMRNNILFSGKTMARDGHFRFSFIVPRDIDYSFGNGKISYYASDGSRDMNGSTTSIVIGGFSGSAEGDTSGPEIKLYMNDTLFRDGGITDASPVLLAVIEDRGGINTTGSGIGHDLTGYLDSRNNSVVLNSYFENDFDNYSKGSVSYHLSGLAEGSHSFTVKAWDNYNNSSEETIHFVVESGGRFLLRDLINYPNPFTGETRITGQVNRPGEDYKASISIISLSGKLVKEIRTTMDIPGYVLPPVVWDGCDSAGHRVARGMYMYTVILTSRNGETCRASGRMIIL